MAELKITEEDKVSHTPTSFRISGSRRGRKRRVFIRPHMLVTGYNSFTVRTEVAGYRDREVEISLEGLDPWLLAKLRDHIVEYAKQQRERWSELVG